MEILEPTSMDTKDDSIPINKTKFCIKHEYVWMIDHKWVITEIRLWV